MRSHAGGNFDERQWGISVSAINSYNNDYWPHSWRTTVTLILRPQC